MQKLLIGFVLILINLQLSAAQRKLVNGSFEEPRVTLNRGWQIFNQSIVPGWSTTDSGGAIEFWNQNLNIATATDGTQLTEMNSNSTANLFQTVCLDNGETISWSFDHRGRTGNDRVRLDFGSQTITDVTTNTAFTTYSGSTTYTGPTGNQNLTFVSVSSGGGASLGNLLDNVIIPAGDYDGTNATSIPINLTINNSFELEGDETIQFSLTNPTGGAC